MDRTRVFLPHVDRGGGAELAGPGMRVASLDGGRTNSVDEEVARSQMRLPGASPGVERSSVRVDIVVFGSLNVDFVVRAPVRPRAGETVRGWGFQLFPGGKGANQAVAAARAGGRVVMAGRVGEDAFKDILLRSLKEAGVDARLVEVTPGTETGSAFITVDDAGQNSIVIVPGANARCSAEDVERVRPLLSAAKVLMLQLEIPMEAVEMAARTASASGVKVLLDPAPAMEMPESLWESVDVITPNEHEAAFLTGHEISDFPEAERAAAALLNRGPRWVVVKMGSRGAVSAYRNSSGGVIFRRFPAFSVPVVDATAAGDAFAGGLAVALCEGKDWDEAIRFASATAALSVTKPGAQTSMPSREEIDAFLRQRGASDLSPSGRG